MSRSLGRWLSETVWGRRTIRIVVLGSANCGKTVFLTALASHLRHHNPESFRLNGWEAFWDESSEKRDARFAAFPFAEYLKGFQKPIPEFPEKTTAEMSLLRLPLVLKKGKTEHAVTLELADLPGERVTDLVMARKNYREWCAWMESVFVSERASESYRRYLAKAGTAATEAELFAAYKEHLVSELDHFSPWITPSIVKLMNGSAKGFRTEIAERLLGVDASSQFVPLPMVAFQPESPLNRFVKAFECGYAKYRRQIVTPIADWLSEADELVYLVDVLGILKKGVAAYNAESAFGTDVIGMFRRRRSSSLFGSVVDFLYDLFTTQIEHAFLAATKADIACGEEGHENMCNLANQLFGKSMRNLGVGFETRACAAVRAVSDSSRARLCGDSVDEAEYSQVVVPERWPSGGKDWDVGKYWFEDVFPRFGGRCDAVLPQLGLDDLVGAILKSYLS